MKAVLNFLLHCCIVLAIQATPKSKTRIIGGEDARDGEFTYQVSLQLNEKNFCGGGIIGDLFVLTAAHCVVNDDGKFLNKQLTAVMGTVDLEKKAYRSIGVKKIFVLKEYRPQDEVAGKKFRTVADIAVLELEEPIGLEKNSRLAKLRLPKSPYPNYTGEKATIAGFGWNVIEVYRRTLSISDEVGISYKKLRSAKANVLSNDRCKKMYIHPVYDSHLCAQLLQRNKGHEGVCSGDSGGPLVLADNTVIGVLSSSPTGCKELLRAATYLHARNILHRLHRSSNGESRDLVNANCRMEETR